MPHEVRLDVQHATTWEDEGKIAASLGYSPSILHTHWRELVSRADAKGFWGSGPLYDSAIVY